MRIYRIADSASLSEPLGDDNAHEPQMLPFIFVQGWDDHDDWATSMTSSEKLRGGIVACQVMPRLVKQAARTRWLATVPERHVGSHLAAVGNNADWKLASL